MKTMYVWIIVIIVAIVLGGLFFGKGNISNLFLFGTILICPLMIFFMHGGHGDHNHDKKEHNKNKGSE